MEIYIGYKENTFWKVPRSLVVVLPAAVMASLVLPTEGNFVVTTR